jgi:nitrogen fixation protein FixH
MNWGFKIAALYIGFVLMILGFVVAASMQEFSLVEDNYYAAEAKYVDRHAQIARANALARPLAIEYDASGQELRLQFPQDLPEVTGSILMYRPSNGRQDQELAIELDADRLQRISTQPFAQGMWKVQVSWEAGGVQYFTEKMVVL